MHFYSPHLINRYQLLFYVSQKSISVDALKTLTIYLKILCLLLVFYFIFFIFLNIF